MNLEQVEGQLSEFEGKDVSVAVPIRGTVYQVFIGKLEIRHNWEQHIISYKIGFCPAAAISFQAQDVHRIEMNPTENLAATVLLKSDTWMEQSKYSHA